jgi:hypothetical protein
MEKMIGLFRSSKVEKTLEYAILVFMMFLIFMSFMNLMGLAC